MKVRVKKTARTDSYGNRIMRFSGLTGYRQSDGTVVFDEESQSKLPKGWIRQGEKLGYDPYSYVFRDSDVEMIK